MPWKFQDDNQVKIFVWSNAIVFSLNLLTLLNAAYNCVRHLYARKVNKVLIILFYVFAFTTTSVYMGLSIHEVIHPRTYHTTFHTVLSSMNTVNQAATFLTDALTMLSLATTIRITLGEITPDGAKTLHKVGAIVAITILVCYIPASLLVRSDRKARHWMRAVVNISILVSSTIILFYLSAKLKRFGAHDTKKTIRSIVTQFMFYLFAYFLLLMSDFWSYIFTEPVFWEYLFVNFYAKTVILIPLNYVIFIHRRTFNQDAERRICGFEVTETRQTEALGNMVLTTDMN